MGRLLTATLALLSGAAAPLAWAGLYDDIYRGLEIFATPSGYPLSSTGDGTRVNGQRAGRLRITPNRVGRGYSLEFDRSFGVDSGNRPEVLDLGLYELQLSGALKATLGYTSRGFLIGNADISASNMTYALRGKSGAQDFEFAGQLNAFGNLEINQLGFYTLSLDVANQNSTLTVDGVLAEGSNATDFTIGPINVKGNIYVDGFVGFLRSVGVDTSALDPLVRKSPIDVIVDTIRNDLLNVGQVAGLQVEADGLLAPGTQAPSTGTAKVTPAAQSGSTGPLAAGTTYVPEPGPLLLIALGGTLLVRPRWR